jgi:hypothetical protein
MERLRMLTWLNLIVIAVALATVIAAVLSD